MATMNEPIEAGGVTPPATVKVWDRFVRVFHWSLAALFLVAYATGDEVEQVHIAAGYTIAGADRVADRLGLYRSGSMHALSISCVRRAKSSPICAMSLCSERLAISGIIRRAVS